MLGISDAAESIGMRTQGVRISLQQLIEDVPLPCILHWNQNHFVVLYDIRKNKNLLWGSKTTEDYIFVSPIPLNGSILSTKPDLRNAGLVPKMKERKQVLLYC